MPRSQSLRNRNNRKNSGNEEQPADKNRASMRKTARFLRILPWLALPLTPVLLVLSYPKFEYNWLAWLALTPFAFFVLRAKKWKSLVSGSFLCGFLSYAGLLYWIYPTMRAGGVQSYFSVLGLVLLAALMSLDFIAVGAFGFFVRRVGNGIFPLLFASGWVCMEWLKISISQKAISFPWFILAYSQWQQPEFIQISSITGVYGLSWALCFSSALLAAIALRKEPFYKRIFGFLPAVLAAGGIWIFGMAMSSPEMASDKTIKVQAALLQPCINLYEKWDPARENEIRQKLGSMVSKLKHKDLVLWPENALPGWIDDPKYALWLDGMSKVYFSSHIVGSVSRGDGKRVAACLITPEGPGPDYHKRILVPFGEYVPFRNVLGKFIGTVAALGEFKPGSMKQSLMQLKGLKIAPTICYESIFPFLYSSDAERGADVFVNITNDGWYLDTSAPYQHLAALVFRAAETRRPILRAANNGISAVINSNGTITASKPLNEEGVLEASVDIPYGQPLSFYVKYGNVFAGLCLLFCLAFAVTLVFL